MHTIFFMGGDYALPTVACAIEKLGLACLVLSAPPWLLASTISEVTQAAGWKPHADSNCPTFLPVIPSDAFP